MFNFVPTIYCTLCEHGWNFNHFQHATESSNQQYKLENFQNLDHSKQKSDKCVSILHGDITKLQYLGNGHLQAEKCFDNQQVGVVSAKEKECIHGCRTN